LIGQYSRFVGSPVTSRTSAKTKQAFRYVNNEFQHQACSKLDSDRDKEQQMSWHGFGAVEW